MKIGIALLLCLWLPAFAELPAETLSKAEAGDAAAQFEAGIYYLKENKDAGHLQVAVDWLKKSAKQKYAPALYEYGHLIMMSNEEDAIPKGVALMNIAADMGFAEAQYQIGLIHGLRKEHTEALAYYEKAANQEHTNSMVVLAEYYESGFGVPKNPEKANQLMNRAIELGNFRAKNWLGRKYEEGRGIKKDLKKAFEMYMETAALGDSEGQQLVARSYRAGIGVKKNYDESVRFARLSLQQHDQKAAGELAVNYLNGYGVKKIPALGYALIKYCGKSCNAEVRIKLLLMMNEISEPEQLVGDQLSEQMRNSTNVLDFVDEYEKLH